MNARKNSDKYPLLELIKKKKLTQFHIQKQITENDKLLKSYEKTV